MKIAVVGDIIVSSGLLAEAAKSLNIDDEPEIKEMIWNADDRKDFQKKALNIETRGPEAEEIPEELYTEIKDTDILLVHFCPVLPCGLSVRYGLSSILSCLRFSRIRALLCSLHPRRRCHIYHKVHTNKGHSGSGMFLRR